MDGVDQRTQLAGHNRLKLLLFGLGNGQTFGINVFKVREAIPCPPLTQIPHAHPVVRGVARIRDQAITIFDLSMGMGEEPPNGIGHNSFLTAITKIDDQLTGIIDVEKALAEVFAIDNEVAEELVDSFTNQDQQYRPHILVADDSSVARSQFKKNMTQIGIDTTHVYDGKQALEQL